jgi:SSS family solute:Na+ symporter
MSSPLIYAILYFVIVIGATSFYFRGKVKNIDDFQTGGKTLNWVMVAFGVSLIPLGSGHTMNLWEAQAGMGTAVLWWSITVGAFFLPPLLLWFGPWLRELGVSSFSESVQALYGKRMGYLHAATNIASWTGICMAEITATGGAIYGLSFGKIPMFPWCILVAFVLVIVYIIFGGILQYSVVSVVNGAVLIIGSYLALFMVGGWLVSQGMGWDFIGNHYVTIGEAWKLEVFRFTPKLFTGIIIPIAVLHISAAAVTNGVYIPILSAKNNREIRKATFLAAGVNGISAFPWVMMGLIGMAIPAVVAMAPDSALAAKLVVPNLALTALPAPLIGLLMVCLLCATLSTGSAVIMGNAQVIVDMIFKGAFKPNMKDQTRMKLARPMIIICAAIACVPAFFNAPIMPVFFWAFSFGVPLFVVWMIGLLWKVSKPAAWITVVAAIIANFWWTFACPSWATGDFTNNVYPVAVVSIVFGIILTAILPGQKGLLSRVRAEKKAKDLPEIDVPFETLGL